MTKFDRKNGKSLVRPSQQLRWQTRRAKAPSPSSRCALGARRENPLNLGTPMRPLPANPKKVPQVSPKIGKFHPLPEHAKNGPLLRRILGPISKRKLAKAGTNCGGHAQLSKERGFGGVQGRPKDILSLVQGRPTVAQNGLLRQASKPTAEPESRQR